ncbi:50S ribosomal L21, mitochondrial [Olea europaea subsp. europaea]|uniref:Large ribosomal subunit protein bL21m n=1 Tax=Olea europaea subsp. europaea TaxID=158383 RepID=A0A8S0U4S4_OLEEU|nr:50S ribosomal L21, mitochondrial [Olea europaea subsp. europaea]
MGKLGLRSFLSPVAEALLALDAKVIIFKKKRRKYYRRTKGHRQELTKLRITDIRDIFEDTEETQAAIFEDREE